MRVSTSHILCLLTYNFFFIIVPSETHLGSFKYCIRLECTGTSIRPLLAGASLVRKGIIIFINFVYWRAVYLLAVAIRILLL